MPDVTLTLTDTDHKLLTRLAQVVEAPDVESLVMAVLAGYVQGARGLFGDDGEGFAFFGGT